MGEIFVFDHACFHTEEKKVLDDLTLTIPRGACFCFVGPSGAGKSSVVRLLNRYKNGWQHYFRGASH